MATALILGAQAQLAAPAIAQSAAPESGVVLNKSAAAAKADKVERQTEAFFECIVDHDPVDARIVALRADSAKTIKAVKKLSMLASECLGKQEGIQLTTNYTLYGGGLARVLYLRSNPARPANDVAPPAIVTPVTTLESTTAGARDTEALTIFSDCVVANAHPGADAFIRANPGSAAEVAALSELKKVMPDCLTTSDTLALSRQSLRAGLSIALYKQYAAAGAAAATAGKQ